MCVCMCLSVCVYYYSVCLSVCVCVYMCLCALAILCMSLCVYGFGCVCTHHFRCREVVNSVVDVRKVWSASWIMLPAFPHYIISIERKENTVLPQVHNITVLSRNFACMAKREGCSAQTGQLLTLQVRRYCTLNFAT